MTPLQTRMIRKISGNTLNDAHGKPANAQGTETWIDGIVETPEDRSVFDSLVEAGIVYHRYAQKVMQDGVRFIPDSEYRVGLTEAGFAAYLALQESA